MELKPLGSQKKEAEEATEGESPVACSKKIPLEYILPSTRCLVVPSQFIAFEDSVPIAVDDVTI